jgi:hypothetical protein
MEWNLLIVVIVTMRSREMGTILDKATTMPGGGGAHGLPGGLGLSISYSFLFLFSFSFFFSNYCSKLML